VRPEEPRRIDAQEQLETDVKCIRIGQEDGAKLLRGGRRLTDGELAHGHFMEPTAFDRVTASMRVAQDEIFGPALSVIRARGFEEALEAANSVRYGLSSSIFTTDVTRLFRSQATSPQVGAAGGALHPRFGFQLVEQVLGRASGLGAQAAG